MIVKTLGEIKVDISIIKEFIKSVDAEDIDGEMYICDLASKKELHPKYMKNPYKSDRQYRAYSFPRENKIFIFLNEGEIFESILWLIAHELSHHNLRKNKYLKKCCHISMLRLLESRNITWNEFMANYDSYIEDDDFHDSLLEETICNNFATTLIGNDFGRKWWKNQLKDLDLKKTA